MTIPSHVGVLGGGRMGAGIAHAFILAGARVTVIDRDETAAASAADRIELSIVESVRRQATDRAADELRDALSVGTDVASFADAGLVIEAVPEDPALKADALRRVEERLPDDAMIASNTSSISIGSLAAELRRPERFLGMHFFNPVPASALVEIVTGPATDPAVAETVRGWVLDIGKTPITVTDAPGFASSRLGVALALEAIRMLEAGVASADDIDTAMVLGYKHPIGPLRLTDLVGLDVRLAIAEYLHAELGPRFEPPQLLRRLVAEGKLGRKSGEGFYHWTNEEMR
ncbi:3-hydroxyacyl-CoA dehydrogenase family protein [Diaminobutyricimonas sp. LJ205]|uniref:3-hydroxyacyl-CoA dehydrogenase family protein n=1 Tax=Diaminobutyricimonas sp. LJ205 TaxID=2683590 RepID=UPI0012F478D5|nr:3-hydroxyacyl-CoA dehydrogenase family protein [Diaminobutyricimonas sp. LJ205]